MRRATARRNLVLQRMADEKYITQAAADAARQKPVVTRGQPNQPPGIAPFFVEEVRKHLEKQYGAKALSRGTGPDQRDDRRWIRRLQELGSHALERGLRAYDQTPRLAEADAQRGRRKSGPSRASAMKRWTRLHRRRRRRCPGGRHCRAEDRRGPAFASARSRRTSIAPALPWTRRTSPEDLFAVGDIVDVAIAKLDEASHTATVTLEQSPLAEGALIAIDNHTGQIKAMAIGGWSFGRSKFNRAVQAYRQLGSTFKPIVYTAAIDRGFHRSGVGDRRRTGHRLPGRQRADLHPAELRSPLRGADLAALRRSRIRATFRRSS